MLARARICRRGLNGEICSLEAYTSKSQSEFGLEYECKQRIRLESSHKKSGELRSVAQPAFSQWRSSAALPKAVSCRVARYNKGVLTPGKS